MARTQAISALQATGTKASLAEIYGIVIDAVKKDLLSETIKSQAYTGNPAAGSVEFRRLINAQAKAYGTARAAGKGDAITAAPITVNLSTHREIVEEMAKFDLDTLGVSNIMARRAINHIDAMAGDLETAFFAAAATAATAATLTEVDEADQLEELIQLIETVKNDYVNGVPRSQIIVVCSPAFYGKVRKKLDSLPTNVTATAAEEIGAYHGAKTASSIYLPTGVKMLGMAIGSVAQPAVTYPYSAPAKVPQSNDFSVELFYDYGTTALSPDLIFKA